jgi:hypothetical protein
MKLPCDFVAVIYHDPDRDVVPCAMPGCKEAACYMGQDRQSCVCKCHVSQSLFAAEGECPICLEALTAKSIAFLPYKPFSCRHVYHIQCAETWVSSGGRTCPMCRKTMAT